MVHHGVGSEAINEVACWLATHLKRKISLLHNVDTALISHQRTNTAQFHLGDTPSIVKFRGRKQNGGCQGLEGGEENFNLGR